jgi:hypothetical protein
VLSNDGSVVYAMFHTKPDFRTVVTEEATVTFTEVPVGVPPAVRSLFYGGESGGYEFVYPKGGPNMIAEIFPQPPITYALLPEAAAVAPVMPPVEPLVDTPMATYEAAPPMVLALSEPAPEQLPVELPRTASPVPLIALGGMSSALAGLVVRLVRRRVG